MMSTTMTNLISHDLTPIEIVTESELVGTLHLEEAKAILETKYGMILMM